MKDYSELEEVLKQKGISNDDQEFLKKFLLSFSFPKRQQLMGIFLGFPEKIALYLEVLKKKAEFEKTPTEALSVEILELENSEINRLMSELQ